MITNTRAERARFASEGNWKHANRFLGICAVICLLAGGSTFVYAATMPTDSEYVLGPVDAVAIAIADNPSLAVMRARFEARSAIPVEAYRIVDLR